MGITELVVGIVAIFAIVAVLLTRRSQVGRWIAAAGIAATIVLGVLQTLLYLPSEGGANETAPAAAQPADQEAAREDAEPGLDEEVSDGGSEGDNWSDFAEEGEDFLVEGESPVRDAASLPPAGPIGSQRQGYFACKIFFATDREVGKTPQLRFTSERGNGDLVYGAVEVSIPDVHKLGRIEGPEWWRFWAWEDPKKYVVVLSNQVFDGRSVFAAEVEQILGQAGRDDVLLFLHGYNVEFEEAAKRTAQLAYDLKFPGVPMFYSWPSRGDVDAYPADEASVEWSAPHFEDFLRFVVTEVGAKKVHIIAHSMGNRALVRALSTLNREGLPPGAAELRQIILAAPDIDAGVFKQLAASFPGRAERITLYSSRADKAILASKKFHRYPRAGGSIVVVRGVDTIDASTVHTDFLAHSYYGDSIIEDIADIIQRDLTPAQRGHKQRPFYDDGVYWEYLHLSGPRIGG
jgi:esterase/lipase superfamily enzyme